MEPRFKLWIEEGGELVFSNGRAGLLRRIEARGSITAAAREMGMSYRAAWGKLRKCEERLGFQLLLTHAGGRGGGGTSLTPEAREFLARFEAWRSRMEVAVKASFEEVFRK
ncbi:MAG: LysR family transcriptional regulator [Bacillota bacterium]|nr:LysR family transcriptional regulator [Bacillota bacterium]